MPKLCWRATQGAFRDAPSRNIDQNILDTLMITLQTLKATQIRSFDIYVPSDFLGRGIAKCALCYLGYFRRVPS